MKRCCGALIHPQEANLVRNLLTKPKFYSSILKESSYESTNYLIRPKAVPVEGKRAFSQTIDNSKHDCGHISVNGRNKINEDRYKLTELKSGIKYYSVFDGHCGEFASNFVNETLPDIILKEINSFGLLNDNDYKARGESMLKASFDKCENHLKEAISSQDFDKKTSESLGSTALVALIINQSKLLISHVGDSRAVLCKSGSPVCLTSDHTPDNELEVDRILESGGWIDWDTKMIPYVNGLLSMTRSFGDLGLQNIGITHTPFVFQSDLDHNTDQFLILCSDGISNWINDEDMVYIVSQFQSSQEAALALISCARQYGSNDDATAIVIKLGGWKDVVHRQPDSMHHLLRTNVSRRY